MRPLILVVDDNPTIQELLAAVFRSHGFDVEVASDGAQAVRAALQLRPAAVVMDGLLPVLDGWSATEEIKARNPQQCVVMLSAYSEPKHLRRARQVGCDYFISKLEMPHNLVRVVRDCID